MVAGAMEGGPRDAPEIGSVGHSGGEAPSGCLMALDDGDTQKQ